MKNKTIWRAGYESYHYDFEAYSNIKKDALKILKKGLEDWKKRHQLEDDWYEPDDIALQKFELNNAYLDGHMKIKSQ